MAEVTIDMIKQLRETTGAGMMDAKKALVEANGDLDGAIQALRKKGAARAAKRADRETGAGIVASYVHGDRIGVLAVVNCETDFVARTDDFKAFAKDVAMHIAAAAPQYANPESVPADVIAKERDVFASEVEGKPAEIQEKIIEGKLAKFYESVCLVKQPYIKNPDKSIEEYMTEVSAKVGEKIRVSQFSRMEIGG